LQNATNSVDAFGEEFLPKAEYEDMIKVIDAANESVRDIYLDNQSFVNEFVLGGISLKLEVIGLGV
jgi:hypothetical protein